MTVGTVADAFGAGLPTLSYDDTETAAQVSPRFEEAQRQAPIALGPHGPEALSYALGRAVLRDPRFEIPPGIHLLIKGISSGPPWDKVTDSLLCLEGPPTIDCEAWCPGRSRHGPPPAYTTPSMT